MSAFLCSTTHTLAVALAVHAIDGTPVRPTALALRALNNAAMLHTRGPDQTSRLYCSQTAIGAAMRWLEGASAADRAKLAACLEYQCAEGEYDKHPSWPILVHCVKLLNAQPGAARASNVWSI